jgi:hypothetical protein
MWARLGLRACNTLRLTWGVAMTCCPLALADVWSDVTPPFPLRLQLLLFDLAMFSFSRVCVCLSFPERRYPILLLSHKLLFILWVIIKIRLKEYLSWQWRRLCVPALEKQSIIFGACGFSFLSLIFYYSTEVPYSSGHDSLRAFAKA